MKSKSYLRSLPRRDLYRRVGLLLLLGTARALGADTNEVVKPAEELKTMSLEELMETKVISVSRTPAPWWTAPMAIDVLTHDDIHRSGATRLPEALRLATGLNVARFVGSSYAISARGFNTTAANKMEVLMDGRSLYTPLLSGTFWEIQDTLLEDLERIEVVRGPGGTIWGANAVNGVINIISKSARDTQGTLLMGGGGTEERVIGGARYGGKIGENTFYRVYAKYHQRDEQIFSNGTPADDQMEQEQGGFRIDSYHNDVNQFTLQGDGYYNQFGIFGRSDAHNKGGNVLGRWVHTISADSDFQLQAYYDRGIRDVPLQFAEDRGTADVQAQHHFHFWERHQFVWGGNYRVSSDETAQGNRTFQFDPPERSLQLFGGFFQDQITLVEDLWDIYLGTKVEHNDFSGFEVQPSARTVFTPAKEHTVWAAVSRAVRAPTRGDADTRFIPNPANGFVLIYGNPEFRSEDLIAYELGYRVQPHEKVTVDLGAFYNVYDHLRTLEPQSPLGAPLLISNMREGDTYGTEISVKYQLTSWWRLSGWYSVLQEDLKLKPGSQDPFNGSLEGNDPHHLASLHSSMDLPGHFQFDGILRYVDRLPNPRVPNYLSLDLRLGWYPVTNLELAVVGQNLLDNRHPEFGGSVNQVEVQRGVYGKVTWRF